jgi:tetratricopeptide (TPR) repeat protein
MKLDCDIPCMRLGRKQLLFCAMAMAVSTFPLSAQQQNSQYSPRFGMGHLPDATVVHNSTVDSNAMADEARCFPWKLSVVRAGTVDVHTLSIPSTAKHEYEKACDASKKNKYEEVEQHARGAIEKFETYPAAWVMLGLSLVEQQKAQEAHDACSHAAKADAAYLPAYLCSAEVSTRNAEWKQVLNASNMAISLNVGGDSYAFYYRATAYLHMNNLEEAKKNALQAAQIDVNHNEPALDLLMSQIYEREGDNARAIAQLQQLLKRHPDRQTTEEAKQRLATLESQQSAK